MLDEELFAGWAEADITPNDIKTVKLEGQYYERIPKDIHSRLKVVALVLEQGNEYSVMITLDVVGVPEAFCRETQKAISDKIPEITANRIILNAIHTHNSIALDVPKHLVTRDQYSGSELRTSDQSPELCPSDLSGSTGKWNRRLPSKYTCRDTWRLWRADYQWGSWIRRWQETGRQDDCSHQESVSE